MYKYFIVFIVVLICLQGLTYYDRPDNIELLLPRVNISGAGMHGKTEFAPTSAQSYVDETVRFTTMERSANCAANNQSGSNCSTATTATVSSGSAGIGTVMLADASTSVKSNVDNFSYLPLDENYKSYKSVLGSEKSADLSKQQSSVFSTAKTVSFIFN